MGLAVPTGAAIYWRQGNCFANGFIKALSSDWKKWNR